MVILSQFEKSPPFSCLLCIFPLRYQEAQHFREVSINEQRQYRNRWGTYSWGNTSFRKKNSKVP